MTWVLEKHTKEGLWEYVRLAIFSDFKLLETDTSSRIRNIYTNKIYPLLQK